MIPTIELALLRIFKTKGKNNDKLPNNLPEAVFNDDPLSSFEIFEENDAFLEEITVGDFVDLLKIYIEARQFIELENFRTEKDKKRKETLETYKDHIQRKSPQERQSLFKAKQNLVKKQDEVEEAMFIAEMNAHLDPHLTWIPRHSPDKDSPVKNYKYWLTVYARVVFAHNMLYLTTTHRKITCYVTEKGERHLNNQIPLMRYLDDTADTLGHPVRDVDVDVFSFIEHYRPLGQSNYPDDADLIKQRRFMIQNKLSPKQVLVKNDINEIPELHEQADLVRKRIRGNDKEFIKWLVYGTADQHFEHKIEMDPQIWKLPWVKCKRFIDVDDILNHTYWAGLLVSLYQLGLLMHSSKILAVQDAAYLWQLAFLDLIDICDRANRYDDKFLFQVDKSTNLSVLEVYYPYNDRAFFEGDLPNLGHTLGIIPLYGEQEFPKFDIGLIINKSMNFACVRRLLSEKVCEATSESKAIWKVISRIMWCMLAGTYKSSRNRLDGNTALKIKRMCDSEDYMRAQLSKDKDRSCRVIFTAIRSYIVYYGTRNSGYIAAASHYIHWYNLVDDTRTLAEKIRGTNLRANDTFAEARMLLERHNKGDSVLVYRYKSGCLSEELFGVISQALEKNSFRELEDSKRDLFLFETTKEKILAGEDYSKEWSQILIRADPEFNFFSVDARFTSSVKELRILQNAIDTTKRLIQGFEKDVPKKVKTNIINTVFRVPENMRFEESTFSILTETEYGGLDYSIVAVMRSLIRLYYARSSPKESEEQIAHLDTYHLRVLTWYLHCCRLFDRIHLIPLDAKTQRKIELAMKVERVRIFPGIQEITDKDFEVYVTLCCERVVTEKNNSFGHDDVRYNMEYQTVVCKRTKQLTPSDFSSLCKSDSEVEERAKIRKTEFLHIPCKDQPVMRICIRGYSLQMGSKRGTKRRYMHCPQCACFHQVKTACYMGEGGYKCTRCLATDKTITQFWKCAYCEEYLKPLWVERKNSKPTGPQGDWAPPNTTIPVLRVKNDSEFYPMTDPVGVVQDIFLCDKHHGYARKITKNTPRHAKYNIQPIVMGKQELMRKIGDQQYSNVMRSDRVRFTKRGIPNKKD